MPSSALTIAPLAPADWPLIEDLFGPERGADSGCWCMWWRVSRRTFRAMGRDARKSALRTLCEAGEAPGLLAIRDGRAVGWCAIARLEAYPVLQRSRVAGPAGDVPASAIWFISCLYVRVGFRRSGLTSHLIRAATLHARARGAQSVEACPIEHAAGSDERFVGTAATFARCGSVEIARRSPRRPLMRWTGGTESDLPRAP